MNGERSGRGIIEANPQHFIVESEEYHGRFAPGYPMSRSRFEPLIYII
jgi:hypothetical protein